MEMVLKVTAIKKYYKEKLIINNCSFNIKKGEIYGLLGINGAGKTTLMKMILGLQHIDEGHIYFLDKEIYNSPKYLKNIGSMIEIPTFYEHLTASELLSMHLRYMQKEANISQILHLVGLDSMNQNPVSQYSLGMKQRLGLARAIIHKPQLLILDEPLNGLDPIAITQMRDLMRTLTDTGMSILLSSHIIGEIKYTVDRVGILSDGFIKQEFSVVEKREEYGENFENNIIQLMKGK